MLTEEGLRALAAKTLPPHPPPSGGTFSPWEKDGPRCGHSRKGSRSSQWEELSAELTEEGLRS